MYYRPEIGRFHLKRHRLRRLHRKLVVIDAKIAFVGGINIISDDNAPPELRPHYDYAVRIEGPTLATDPPRCPPHVGDRLLGQLQATLPA